MGDINSRELFEKASEGDIEARNIIVENNMGLVYKIALKYRNTIDMDTAVQEGAMGLMNAASKFDVDRGLQFSTFAVNYIDGRIKRFLRDQREDKPYRIRREDYALCTQIYKAQEKLCPQLGREATFDEIATYIGVEVEKVSNAFNAMNRNMSLYDLKHSDDKDRSEIIDFIENENNISEDTILDNIVLEEALEGLDDRSRKIIELRYKKYMSQGEIGKAVGLSQVQVSRIEKKALNNLKDLIEGRKIKKIIPRGSKKSMANKNNNLSGGNTLADLNNHLFSQIERLSDDSLKGENLKHEIDRANSLAKVASQIISNGNLALKVKILQDEKRIFQDGNVPVMLETTNAKECTKSK